MKAKVAPRELQSSSLGLSPASQCSEYPKQDRLDSFTSVLLTLSMALQWVVTGVTSLHTLPC